MPVLLGAPLLLIHGTWGRGDRWYRPGSPLVVSARAQGLDLLHPEPFLWSGRIGGLPVLVPDDPDNHADDGGRLEWANEGRHLTYYCAALRPGTPVSIISHSHGGNLAAIAIARGDLMIRHLITVSTPVRKDMEPYYREARRRIDAGQGHWIHTYGDWWRDIWLKVGELGDGRIGWHSRMPWAHTNLHARGAGHSDVIRDPSWFDRLGLWEVLSA